VLEPAAFPEEEHGLGFDGAEQIHHGGGRGAAHPEIDDRDFAGGGTHHRSISSDDWHAMRSGEQFDVLVEVGEQNVVAEFLQRHAGVARQPVLHDRTASLHGLRLSAPAHPNTPQNGSGEQGFWGAVARYLPKRANRFGISALRRARCRRMSRKVKNGSASNSTPTARCGAISARFRDRVAGQCGWADRLRDDCDKGLSPTRRL